LERVLAQLVLRMARGAGSAAAHCVVSAKHMHQTGRPEPSGSIGFPPLVDQEREGDAGVVAKRPRVQAISESDRRQHCTFFAEHLLVVTQLRDVLTAEDSPIVAQEHQHRRSAGPQ